MVRWTWWDWSLILRILSSFSALMLLVASFDPWKPTSDMTYVWWDVKPYATSTSPQPSSANFSGGLDPCYVMSQTTNIALSPSSIFTTGEKLIHLRLGCHSNVQLTTHCHITVCSIFVHLGKTDRWFLLETVVFTCCCVITTMVYWFNKQCYVHYAVPNCVNKLGNPQHTVWAKK